MQTRVIKAMDLLLDAGANINARITDSHTRTAKLVAYIQGRDHEGKTAIFSAAEAGWDKVVKHLIDRGADPTVRDASGKTALDYARSPPPPGPGAPRDPGPAAVASRAATIALLEGLVSEDRGQRRDSGLDQIASRTAASSTHLRCLAGRLRQCLHHQDIRTGAVTYSCDSQ